MNDFFDNYEYLEDMFDIFDWIDNDAVRVPKRYIRDAENPFEMYTDVQFFCRFRFPKEIVLNVIMHMVHEDREEFIHTDNRGLPVDRLFKVLIALRFYASGNYQRVNGDILGLSQSTVSRVIREISKRIASTTNIKKWIKLPTIQESQEIKQQFYDVAKFPGVIGAIDCTHIPIKSPRGDNAEMYRNRKGWMSINTQIVCGPDMKILDVVCRWPGLTHDIRIFNNSRIKSIMESGVYTGHLIGDSGYAQTKYLYTPKLMPISAADIKYNMAHIKTRNIIERVNGVLKSRFRCLCRKLCTNLNTSTLIIICCAILHNIALNYNLQLQLDEREEELIILPRINIPVVENQRPGNLIKTIFIERHFT